MKVLIASIFLMGFMSCAHHGKKGECCHKKAKEGKECKDESCKLEKGEKKACCKKEKKAES